VAKTMAREPHASHAAANRSGDQPRGVRPNRTFERAPKANMTPKCPAKSGHETGRRATSRKRRKSFRAAMSPKLRNRAMNATITRNAAGPQSPTSRISVPCWDRFLVSNCTVMAINSTLNNRASASRRRGNGAYNARADSVGNRDAGRSTERSYFLRRPWITSIPPDRRANAVTA
jgi:hypothetical protein